MAILVLMTIDHKVNIEPAAGVGLIIALGLVMMALITRQWPVLS